MSADVTLLAVRVIGVTCLLVCGCNEVLGTKPTTLEFPDAAPLIDAVGCSGSTFSGLSPFPFALSPAYDPVLSGDSTQLWFDHYDNTTTHGQVFFATGSAGGSYSGDNPAPFIDPTKVADSGDPALTEDGLCLVFVRLGGAWQVTRAAITDAFPATASPLGSLAAVDSVAVNRDGLTVYFARNGELYSASRPKLMDDFATPVDLGVAGHDPSISPDELELFYDTTGQPSGDVQRRVRPSIDAPFGPSEVIQTGAYEPSITFDSRTLLMVQTSTPVVMQMTRTCP